jgi:hypothetical protein
MPKESETSRKIIAAVKAGDKLVQDIKKDAGLIVLATKELGGIFKEFLGKKDNQGGD